MRDDNIGNLDKNLAVLEEINVPDVKYYDVREEPFQIYGLYNPKTEPEFKRLPDEIGPAVNETVAYLYRHTAGGRVRFSTNSPYVVIKAFLRKINRFSHMTLLGTSGFDLYVDTPDGKYSTFHGSFVPPCSMTEGYESKLDFREGGNHFITINFPLYNYVTDLYIGIAEGSTLEAGAPYLDVPPIVYYGSSVTQGGCASRPGTVYQSIISRDFNIDHINLGFSGSGRGEDIIIDYMAGLDMSAFVSDYDHNSPSAEHLAKTHKRMYEVIREKHPDIPYIMISRLDYDRPFCMVDWIEETKKRRAAIQDNFYYARSLGDDNVYYIDGESIFKGRERECCTVDSCHPNDLGFYRMYEAVAAVLRRAKVNGKFLK